LIIPCAILSVKILVLKQPISYKYFIKQGKNIIALPKHPEKRTKLEYPHPSLS
jgi:hypothetical protein